MLEPRARGAVVGNNRFVPVISENRGVVVAVSRGADHRFSKQSVEEVILITGWGIEGDAHAGTTVRLAGRGSPQADEPIHSGWVQCNAHRGQLKLRQTSSYPHTQMVNGCLWSTPGISARQFIDLNAGSLMFFLDLPLTGMRRISVGGSFERCRLRRGRTFSVWKERTCQ